MLLSQQKVGRCKTLHLRLQDSVQTSIIPRNILKQKFLVFLNSLVALILEAVYVAIYILLGFGLSQLVKYTIGAKWTGVMDNIRHGTLIVVSVVGAFRFIARTGIQTYRDLKKELNNEHNRTH